MAIPPSIPTSFVPKQPVQTNARRMRSGSNPLIGISFAIAGAGILGAGGIFAFQQYLIHVHEAKAAELTKAQANIDPDTVEQFLRLRNRLLASNTLLNQHVAISQFFDILESVTLQSVRFGSLKLEVKDDRSATVTMGGTASTFNALAAESAAFASQKLIKRAIFSGIAVNTDGTVSFLLTAELDPKLVLTNTATAAVDSSAHPLSLPVAAPAASTTPAILAPAPSVPVSAPATTTATTTPKGPIHAIKKPLP